VGAKTQVLRILQAQAGIDLQAFHPTLYTSSCLWDKSDPHLPEGFIRVLRDIRQEVVLPLFMLAP